MNVSSRRVSVAGLLGFVAVAASATGVAAQVNMQSSATQRAQQQAAQTPPSDPSIPRLLIGTFRTQPPMDANVGLELSEKLRETIRGAYKPKEVWVAPREFMNKALSASAYPADTALGTSDVLILGGFANAAEVLDGVASKSSDGSIRLESRFFYQSKQAESEVFAPVSGKNVDEVVKSFAETYKQMRKQLPAYTKCRSALYGKRYDEAAGAARGVLTANPSSGLGRVCLLSAYLGMVPKNHADSATLADSTVRVASDLLQRDTTNLFYLQVLFQSHATRGDQRRAAEYAVRAYNQNQADMGMAQTAINILVNSGSPDAALPIVNSVLKADPNNVQAYTTLLNLQLVEKKYKEADQTARTLIRLDTAAATIDFFRRMAGAAQADSNQAMYLDWISLGTMKFTRDATLWLAYFDALYRAGKLQEALRAALHLLDINPKDPQANAAVVGLFVKLDMGDSVFAFAVRTKVAGVDSATTALIGSQVVQVINHAMQTNLKDDWKGMMSLSQRADSIAPQPGTKFFVGLSAVQLGIKNLQDMSDLQKATPVDRVKICALALETSDLFTQARTSMSPPANGGRFNPEAANNIMKGVSDNAAVPQQYITTFKCK